jgi:alkylation response protein AidB-like acyl-CoA dehydrogenase
VNFDLDTDQRDAAAAAREFFGEQASPSAAREALEGGGPLRPGRKALADVGFLGITVAEDAGGAGRGLLDLAVVAEQGGAVLAGPSLVTAARAAVLLADVPELAAQLADGSSAFAVVDGSPDGSHPSVDAADATTFLALDGRSLVVGEGVATPGTPLDATRGLASVRLTSRRVLVEDADALWARARQAGAVIMAAEDLGAADRAVALGVAYAKEREAFGRTIGSYQAVKHMLVDAWVGVDQLRSLVWWAAWAADAAPGELALAAAAAKAQAASAFERAAETLIQVHGGIGFTWEHDAHLYWRRAKVDRLLLGDEAEHLDTVARLAVAGALGA